MASPSKQLTLFVDFYIRPDYIEEWKEAHRPVWDACANEPKCIFFDVFSDPNELGHFRLVEVWNASREWFETQQLPKPYYDELWAKTEKLYAKDRRIQYFEREGEGCSFKSLYLRGGRQMD